MKFSIRQILASTVGAVIAAVVASSFGVKGTIIGVAIGSAAATMATALVAQSIDRGHEAVKQVAVRVPDASTLLRKLGGTGVSGPSASSVDSSSAPAEVVTQPSGYDGEATGTIEMASTAAPVDEAGHLEISAGASAPATERLVASTSPVRPAVVRPTGPGRFSWRPIALSAVTVFVLALLFITAIELISGKPLSSVFGGADTGTTLNNLVNPGPAPATTPASPTSTTSTTSSTPGAGSSTTSTTTGGASTSTTAPPGGETTTTTSTLGTSSTTTTAAPGAGAVTTTTTTAAAVP